MKSTSYLLLLVILLLVACEKAEQTYSTHTARFVFQNTQLVPQLNTSLNNPGEFCTIRAYNNQWLFSSPGIRDDYPYQRTEQDKKAGYILGINGLIVGTPIFSEQLTEQNNVVCFDLVCPNCYEDASIARSLVLKESQRAVCNACTRQYDLNNLGAPASGGTSLYRYRAQYGNNTLVINNY